MRAVITVTTPLLGETTLTLETSDPAPTPPVGRSDAVAAQAREVASAVALLDTATAHARDLITSRDSGSHASVLPASQQDEEGGQAEVPGAQAALSLVNRHPSALRRPTHRTALAGHETTEVDR